MSITAPGNWSKSMGCGGPHDICREPRRELDNKMTYRCRRCGGAVTSSQRGVYAPGWAHMDALMLGAQTGARPPAPCKPVMGFAQSAGMANHARLNSCAGPHDFRRQRRSRLGFTAAFAARARSARRSANSTSRPCGTGRRRGCASASKPARPSR